MRVVTMDVAALDIPDQSYVLVSTESKFIDDFGGGDMGHDLIFWPKNGNYTKYAVRKRHYPTPGGPLHGSTTIEEITYLLVSPKPFIIVESGMGTTEDYGTDAAERYRFDKESQVVTVKLLNDYHIQIITPEVSAK